MPNETLQKKDYIQSRWTSEQARFEKWATRYQQLSITITVSAILAIVGALVYAGTSEPVQIVLLAIALLATSVNLIYDPKAKAQRYRGIAAALRREREMYDAGIGIYDDTDKAFSRFVYRCEAIIQSSPDTTMPILIDMAEETTTRQRQPTLPSAPSPFNRSSSSSSSSTSSLRSRLSSSRFSSTTSKQDEDEDEDNENDQDTSARFGNNPFSSRSSSFFSGRTSSNRPSNSPFGSSARFGGGRPIGSSGGMRREGNDDPALAGIQTGNGNTGVRFSAYYPKELTPKQWHPLKAYAFMGYAVDAVSVDAEGGDIDKLPEILYDRSRQVRYHIPEGAQVMVTPRMKGFQFNPQSVNIGFYRPWHRFDFEIRAVDVPHDEATNGYLTFTVDGLVVADVPLSVYVTKSLSKNRKEVIRHVTRKPYRGVYASFADEDSYLAKRLQRVYDALGMYRMRDIMQQRLKTGWSEDMLQTINDTEVFQLFWSDAAADADNIQRELAFVGEHVEDSTKFVRVFYWEQPPADLPEMIRHVNPEYLPDIAE